MMALHCHTHRQQSQALQPLWTTASMGLQQLRGTQSDLCYSSLRRQGLQPRVGLLRTVATSCFT